MEAANHAVLGLLFVLCFSLISLEVAVQEMITEYNILLQFSGDWMIFMCQSLHLMSQQVVMQDCAE